MTKKSQKGGIPAGLALPFPSAPTRPGKYCMYFIRGEQRMINIFAAPYSAKKFFEAVLDGDKYKMISKTQLVMDCGIELRCDTLEEIINHKYTKDEAAWELPMPYPRQASVFRQGPATGDEKAAKQSSSKTEKTSKPKPEPKPKKERKPKPSRDGLVSVADIAEELKMEPREARAILRKQNVEKPEAGWAWPSNEIKAITKIIRDNR